MAQCPHCMTDIHDEASVCPSCGAKKGVYGPGWTAEDYVGRAKVIAALAGFFLLVGVGFLIAGQGGIFILIAIVALFVGCLAVVTLVMSGGKEKWYR